MSIGKKRFLAVVLAALFVFSLMLTGCNGKKVEVKTEQNTQSQQTQEKVESKPDTSKSYTFRFGLLQPVEHLNYQAAKEFERLLKEKTNGRVQLEIYPAEQLGNEKDHADAVSMGVLDFAMIGIGEYAKRYKPTLIFDGPFIFRDREHLVKVFNSPVFEEINSDMAEKIDARSIAPVYYGQRLLTTSKNLVKTPEDLKGLKIRCPDQPMFVSVVKAMGGTPTPMAYSEVYLALQQGVVDGQENPAAAISAMKFYEVQKYIVKTGHIIQGNHIFASEKVLRKLPDDIREAIIEAGKDVAVWANAQSFELEDKYLKELESKGVTFVEPDKEAFIKAAEPLYKEYEEKWGKGLLEKIRAIQ